MNIPVSSGIINAILEAIIVLFVAPVWNKALTRIHNVYTFRNARTRGHGIRVGQGITTLSDPFTLVKTRAAGTKLLLVGEIAMVVVLFWLELSVNGEIEHVYHPHTRFVLNGGGFPSIIHISRERYLHMIRGLHSQSRSCFRRVGRDTYEIYAVAYTSPQNFERDVSRQYGFNESICLDGENAKPAIGVRFVGDYDGINREWDYNTSRFTKEERIPDGLADGIFKDTCEGSLYGRNTFSVLGRYESGSRIMATAIRKDDYEVELEIGGLVNLEDDDPNDWTLDERDYGTSSCAKLNYTRMTRREFSVTLTAINRKMDVRNLARAIISYLDENPTRSGVYRDYNTVDIITELFYSGEVDSDEHPDQEIGQFERMEVRLRGEERRITVFNITAVALSAIVLTTAVSAFLSIVFINNHGRDITSVAWTLGVVRSHYENLGRCWNETPDITTYWVQKKVGWNTHFGPKGYGTIVQMSDEVKNEDIKGRHPLKGPATPNVAVSMGSLLRFRRSVDN